MSGPKILVIGATGLLGAPVTKALVEAGYTVSALVRRPDARLPAGVTACVGDLFDEASLEAAMKGQALVYLNLATQPTDREHDRLAEREGLATLLAVARRAHVRRIGAIVPMLVDQQGRDGFDWWVLRVKQQAVQALSNSGVPVTLFRAASFMENFNAGMRQGNAINLAGKAQHPTRYLAGADFGRLVAAALAKPTEGNVTWVAQGPEALLPEEAAQRFVAAYPGEGLVIRRAPLGVLSFVGLFSRRFGFVARMLDALNRFEEPFVAQRTWDAFGPPVVTIDRFARGLRAE